MFEVGDKIFSCISIHALREESDADEKEKMRQAMISIHALREESDGKISGISGDVDIFQSTLSVRRATGAFSAALVAISPFQSTLSVRRATVDNHYFKSEWIISIHALREESDSSICKP